MATFVPASDAGVTTGTTAVTVVPAPLSAGIIRMLKTLTVYNNDTEERTVTIQFRVSSTNYIAAQQVLQPSESLIFGGEGEVLVLDATTKSIRIVLDSAPLANQLDWTSHWADLTS
jgi:hypothetical protein